MLNIWYTSLRWKWYIYALKKGWIHSLPKDQKKYIPIELTRAYLELKNVEWKSNKPSYEEMEDAVYQSCKFLSNRESSKDDWNNVILPLLDHVFDCTEMFTNPKSTFYQNLYLEAMIWGCHLPEPKKWLIERLLKHDNNQPKSTILSTAESIWIEKLWKQRQDSLNQMSSYQWVSDIPAKTWKLFFEHMHHFSMDWRDPLWKQFSFKKEWKDAKLQINIKPMFEGTYSLYPKKYHLAMACQGVVPGEQDHPDVQLLYRVYHQREAFSKLPGLLLAKYMIASKPEDWIELEIQEPIEIDFS